MEEHHIYRFPIYYEIRGRYHYLFQDSGSSMSPFSCYPEQKCLALFVREEFKHKSRSLHVSSQQEAFRRIITYFSIAPSNQGTSDGWRFMRFQTSYQCNVVLPFAPPPPPPLKGSTNLLEIHEELSFQDTKHEPLA
jgi:hypothetical protein